MPAPPQPRSVAALALGNPSTVLVHAASARTAAELAYRYGPSVPDAEITKNVERFNTLLRAAIGTLDRSE